MKLYNGKKCSSTEKFSWPIYDQQGNQTQLNGSNQCDVLNSITGQS